MIFKKSWACYTVIQSNGMRGKSWAEKLGFAGMFGWIVDNESL